MSPWSMKFLQIQLKNISEHLGPCQNWLKVGKAENKVTQKKSMSFSPDYISPREQQRACHSGTIHLEGRPSEGHFGFYWFDGSGITHKDLQYLTHQEKPWTINGFPFGKGACRFISDTSYGVPFTALSNESLQPQPLHKGAGPRASGSWSLLWLGISTGLFGFLSRVIQTQGNMKYWVVDSCCSFDLSASSMTKTGSEKMKVEGHEIGKIEN